MKIVKSNKAPIDHTNDTSPVSKLSENELREAERVLEELFDAGEGTVGHARRLSAVRRALKDIETLIQ